MCILFIVFYMSVRVFYFEIVDFNNMVLVFGLGLGFSWDCEFVFFEWNCNIYG